MPICLKDGVLSDIDSHGHLKPLKSFEARTAVSRRTVGLWVLLLPPLLRAACGEPLALEAEVEIQEVVCACMRSPRR